MTPSPISLTREQIRRYDQLAIERGVRGCVLMENAARGAVDLLVSLGVSGPIGIVCGKGNNGGDGFVMARLLRGLGCEVSVELVVDPGQLEGEAAEAFAAIADLPIQRSCPTRSTENGLNVDSNLAARLRCCQWIVDAVLGTGITGEVRPPQAAAIATIRSVDRMVFAVDIPSGLDCDRGVPLGIAVRAHHTATFVASKRGFDNPASTEHTGRVHVIDLGVGALVPLADILQGEGGN